MTILKGVTATKGHLASNGGLRGHSVGDNFPVVIGMQGNPHNRLYWFAQAPDGAEMLFPSFEAANHAADAWKELRKAFTGERKAVGITFEIRKVASNEDDEGNTNCESFDLTEMVPFDFFGLYAKNVDGFSEWIADADSALQLGRVVAFLLGPVLAEEYKILKLNTRVGMTLEDFRECNRNLHVTNLEWWDDYTALDAAMSERVGASLWSSVRRY